MKANYSEKGREEIGSLNRGKTLSSETIETMRQSALNRKPLNYTEQGVLNMKKNSKPIIVKELNNTVYGEFNSIVEAAPLKKNDGTGATTASKKTPLDNLQNVVSGQRYLLVLDDVWTAEVFRELKEVLVDTWMGSRVVITTRIEEVPSVADDSNKIKVEPLEEEEAWRLFRRKAFPRTENHICSIKANS